MQHSYTRSQNVEALSIYNQQYRAKIGKEDGKRSRKHLLGLLSSFTREQEQVRSEEVQDLCCYDRMRKLIYKGQVQQQAAKRDLVGVIVIQQKMNQLQSRLNRSQPKVSKLTTQTVKQPLFLRRSCIVEDIKKHCLGKFLSHKVNVQAQGIEQQRKAIERDVDRRIDELIQQKQLTLTRIQEEKAVLQRKLLAKQLQIQALKSREMSLKEHISQLQQQAVGKKESKRPTVSNTNSQNIKQQFHEAFGGMSVEQVKAQLDKAISRCLTMFDRVQNRSKEHFREQTKLYNQKTMTLQARINCLEKREKQLTGGLRKLEQHQQISDLQANELLQSKQRLEDLEKIVLSVYTEWYAQRSQPQKKVLRVSGNLSQNYNYAQMLKYMVEHSKNFSTNEKLNDFLFKVLRGVQKIKRVIYPDQCNEKLDALATIDRIEKWIKIKVSQHQRNPKKKTQADQAEEDYLLTEIS